MHASSQLLSNLLQLRPHPLGDGLSLDREPAFPGLTATTREAQEVERLRLALSLALATFGRKPAEFDEPGLFRV
jgi:hypothetical protein